MPPSLTFRVLGPAEFLKDGSPVPVTAPRQQALFTILALHANHVVPTARLVDAIWDDEPPVTATSQVQICISILRRLFRQAVPEDIIVTRAQGYLLSATPAMVDALQFEQLTSRGQSAAADGRLHDAIHSLRTALALWRGPAADGVQSRVVQVAATRLNEQRLAVLEECIRLELRLGRHAEVIPELAEMVAENPLYESLRAHQMIALARAGRQAEALEVYRSARRMFIDELGIEPGEKLRRIERAILENDGGVVLEPGTTPVVGFSAPDGVEVVAHDLPADIADFTGREDIGERLRAFLTSAPDRAGRPRAVPVAVLTGMAGVGKTALAVHVAHSIKDRFPGGQLFISMENEDSRPATATEVLERCLGALGISADAVPRSAEELVETYRNAVAARRVLIVLDGAVSVAQVAALLPGNPECTVLITSRRRLSDLFGARFFELRPLSPESSVDLLDTVIGDLRPATPRAELAALARCVGHLPLGLRIAAAKILERPHRTVRHLVDRLADKSTMLAELEIGTVGVAASFRSSYDSLSAGARRLFQRLALVGPADFGSWVVEPLIGRSDERSGDHLDELVECRLVETDSSGDGRPVRFRLHELMRAFAARCLAEDQPAGEQWAARTRLLAAWTFLVTEGRSRLCGGDHMVVHSTAPHWQLAWDVVAGLLVNPLEWFRREHDALMSMVVEAADAGLHDVCWDLATTSVAFFDADLLFDDWEVSHGVALAAVRRAGDTLGDAALTCSLGELALLRQRLETAESCFIDAVRGFEAVGNAHGRALAAGHLAFVERLGGRDDQALARFDDALADLHAVGDRVGEAYVLCGMAQVHLDRGEHESAQQWLTRAMTLAADLGARRVQAQVAHGLAELYLEQGELERADRCFRSLLDAARARGDRAGEAYALYGRGVALARMGWDGPASANLFAALGAARTHRLRVVEGRVLLALGELSANRGFDSAALATEAEGSGVLREARALGWRSKRPAAG